MTPIHSCVVMAGMLIIGCHCTNSQVRFSNCAKGHQSIAIENINQRSFAAEQSISSCPPWFIRDNSSRCICGQSVIGIANCCSETLQVPCFPNTSVMTYPCSCITMDTSSNITYAGYCPYTCYSYAIWNSDPYKLNNSTCSPWNRAGRLCEECQENYGISLLSYSLHCVKCSSEHLLRNILLIVVYFITLTIFCFLLVMFRISATRHPFSTFVLVSQVYTTPFQLQALSSHYSKTFLAYAYTLFYDIWNLNILRPLYPSLCLSPTLTNIQAAILEYAIALYPLLILEITVVIIKLHYHVYSNITCGCVRVQNCLARFRRRFNIHESLVDAFSTFLILSYVKIGYTSIYILVPVVVYQPDGTHTTRSYAEPSMAYFGKHHSPYALAALSTLIVFCWLPLLIIFLYPLRIFQKCLNKCSCHCLTLHAFADSFYSGYKDGTEGTCDYRWFAGVHLLIRFAMILLFAFVKNFFLFSLFASLFSFTLVAVIALLKPYKKESDTRIDICLLCGMGSLYFGCNLMAVADHVMPGLEFVVYIMVGMGVLVPALYILAVIVLWIWKVCSLKKQFPCFRTELIPLLRNDN